MSEEYDTICNRCSNECNSDELNMCKDGEEVCNECYGELVAKGIESMDDDK